LRDQVAKFLEMARNGDKNIAYSGADLPGDLAAAYMQEAEQCPITYQASDGSERAMTFEDARARLFAFSFDPYHCPERRWGATTQAELATCPDDGVKRQWYEAEQRLRNQTERTYDARMGFSLGELQARAPHSGQDMPPDIDTLALLRGAADLAAVGAGIALRSDTRAQGPEIAP